MLNAKLERHLARPYVLSHEISAFIYIDDYSFITSLISINLREFCARTLSYVQNKHRFFFFNLFFF